MRVDIAAAPELHERINSCLNGINKLFSPPFDLASGTELVTSIRDQTHCEAVSIFLAKQDPSRLDYIAGVGHTPPYSSMKYYLSDDKQYVTAFVFKNRRAINLSHSEIEKELKIPVFGRSDFYLSSGRALNIVAVPIMAAPDRCYGVLKLENKNDALAEHGHFPKADFGFVSVLASLLGVAFQQRLYGKLAVNAELPGYDLGRKPLVGQLEAISQMLKRQIRAECVSVFIRKRDDHGEVLAYEAGVGYIDGYGHEYRWPDGKSFTVHVAQAKRPLRYTEKELVAFKKADPSFPFSGQCVAWIGSGSFRNILGIPILKEGEVLGVLKLENKLPEDEVFNECDESFCNAFAQGPLLELLVRSGPLACGQTSTRGYRLLIEHLGPPSANELKNRAFIAKIRARQERDPDKITGKDCATYLAMSRATYYREIRQVPKKKAALSRKK